MVILIATTTLKGTEPYMAPEMLSLDGSTFSKATDIYAYGVLMWEITTQDEPQIRIDHTAKTRLWGQLIPNDHTFPDYVLKLLPLCWKEADSERPTITDIMEQFPKGIFFLQCSTKDATLQIPLKLRTHVPIDSNPN